MPKHKSKDRRKLTAAQRKEIASQGGKALWEKLRKQIKKAS